MIRSPSLHPLEPVVVENTVRMNGRADGVTFAEVSHKVRQNVTNHGLVKKAVWIAGREFFSVSVRSVFS